MVFCLVIFVVALTIGHSRKVGDFGAEPDFYGDYVVQADNILAGRPYTLRHHPPGYTLILAGVSRFTHDYFAAGKIMSACATASFGWFTYLLLKNLFGSRVALATTILSLIAVVPFSYLASTDMVGAFTIILALWVFLRRPVLTPWCVLLAGIFTEVAYLIRSQGIFVLVGVCVALMFVKTRKRTYQDHLLSFLIYASGFFLLTSPWLVSNWRTNGAAFAGTGHLQIALHFYHPLDDSVPLLDAFEFGSLFEVVMHDPPKLFKRYLNDVLLNYPGNLFVQAMRFPAYLFAGGGLLMLLGDLTRRRLVMLTVCLLGHLLLGLVGFQVRYYLFLFPCLFLFVCYFLFHRAVITNLQLRRFPKATLSWLLLTILAACQTIDARYQTKGRLASEPRHLIEIADFLRQRSSPQDAIFALQPHYAHLAGIRHVFPVKQTPDTYIETADHYLAKAKEISARYIAYSDIEAKIWPGFKSLANPDTVPDGLRLIYHHKPSNTLIYEVNTNG